MQTRARAWLVRKLHSAIGQSRTQFLEITCQFGGTRVAWSSQWGMNRRVFRVVAYATLMTLPQLDVPQ
jgi:hypothetical protein